MVVWSEVAISHITEFIDEAKEGTEQTAKNYINKLIDYVDILETMPNLGKDVQMVIYKYNVKQIIYKKHRILYCQEDDNITILAVLHTRLDVKKAIRSLKNGLN